MLHGRRTVIWSGLTRQPQPPLGEMEPAEAVRHGREARRVSIGSMRIKASIACPFLFLISNFYFS